MSVDFAFVDIYTFLSSCIQLKSRIANTSVASYKVLTRAIFAYIWILSTLINVCNAS